MLPTIPESLTALRRRMAETVIPALPADPFVQEQSALMLATIDWLLEVQPHEVAYEVVENEDYRALTTALAGLLPENRRARAAERLDAIIGRTHVPSIADVPRVAEAVEQNRELKALAGELFTAITRGEAAADESAVEKAKAQMVEVARRQERRERAFYRMTGFPVDPEELGAVLADQARR